MNFYDERLPQRFWSKVSPCPMTGCWLWIGAITGEAGYGSFCVDRSTQPAHRVAFTAAFGRPAPCLLIDHLCRVRSCVNPLHLEAVTKQVNTLRGIGVSAIAAARTTCIHGHPFDTFNTRVGRNHRGNPKRMCRACERESARIRQNYKGTWITHCGICGEAGHSRQHHDRFAAMERGKR